jgi:hypothetical protein
MLDSLQTAYIRGRKLHGKAVKLPEGYYGTVVEKTDVEPDRSTRQEEADDVEVVENSEDQLQVGAMRGKATFDELMVWGHESTSDASADPYVRGMEEWVTFAEEVRLNKESPFIIAISLLTRTCLTDTLIYSRVRVLHKVKH